MNNYLMKIREDLMKNRILLSDYRFSVGSAALLAVISAVFWVSDAFPAVFLSAGSVYRDLFSEKAGMETVGPASERGARGGGRLPDRTRGTGSAVRHIRQSAVHARPGNLGGRALASPGPCHISLSPEDGAAL